MIGAGGSIPAVVRRECYQNGPQVGAGWVAGIGGPAEASRVGLGQAGVVSSLLRFAFNGNGWECTRLGSSERTLVLPKV